MYLSYFRHRQRHIQHHLNLVSHFIHEQNNFVCVFYIYLSCTASKSEREQVFMFAEKHDKHDFKCAQLNCKACFGMATRRQQNFCKATAPFCCNDAFHPPDGNDAPLLRKARITCCTHSGEHFVFLECKIIKCPHIMCHANCSPYFLSQQFLLIYVNHYLIPKSF